MWAELNAAAFTRAHAEGRLVIIDGSAEWCHWCHVMDATTYGDPAVRGLIAAGFVTVKVDIDARPDFEERYHEWGWPATVLMTAGGVEIARYKGYQPPEKFADLLRAASAAAAALSEDARDADGGAPHDTVAGPHAPLTEEDLAKIAAFTTQKLDSLWDPEQGGWGGPQKLPLAWDNAWALDGGKQAAGHDASDRGSLKHALFVLDQQRKIIDPEWGGLCQYSTNGDWLHPHFEKLIAYQAGAIDNYSTAFALTGDASWLRTAERVRGFVDRFMTSREGGFYATMDADLNAHDPDRPLVTGHDYYAKSDRERRALGIPRVDQHEYPRENGLVIAAYVTLGEAASDRTAIATAARAATRVLSTHGTARGSVTHDAGDDGRLLYLADNAAFGFGLTRLYEATRDPAHLAAADRIARFLLRELAAPDGGFLASTPDRNAVGDLAERREPFEENVMAIRFLAHLIRAKGGEPDPAYRSAIAGALAVVARPEAVEDRGRMVGDLLLALSESRGVR